MPPRKKVDEAPAVEPERRSTRIREAPAKPKATAATPAAAKKSKKADPELAEWRPTKKPAAKKRKQADADVEDGDEGNVDEEKHKKKTKVEPKETKATKGKKAAAEKSEASVPDPAVRKERRKSGTVNVHPAIDEDDETKVEEDILIVGGSMPNIVLKNEKGEDVHTANLVKDTGVVIFAAPKADTPGCNRQACHFRDSTKDFSELGYTVYALTKDSPSALEKWQSKNNLGYSLLSDSKMEFIKVLGAQSGTSTKRSHFVFEKGTGKLLVASIGVKPDQSHAHALDAIKAL